MLAATHLCLIKNPYNIFLNLHTVTVRATVTPYWKFAPTVSVLKGIGPLDEYLFVKAYKIKTVLSVHVRWFIVFLACLVQEENIYKVRFGSLKTLTNLKTVPDPHHNFCTDFPLCHWSISPVSTPH